MVATKTLTIAFGIILILGCASKNIQNSSTKHTPSALFKTSTTIKLEQDEFTKTGTCKLIHSVSMRVYEKFYQEVNRTELIVILNQTSPQWLGVIQEHDRNRIHGGGHFLAGAINGVYLDASLAIKNGITEPFSRNFKNAAPTAVIRTSDILSWLQSGSMEVKFRRASDNVVASIDMRKIEEFVAKCF